MVIFLYYIASYISVTHLALDSSFAHTDPDLELNQLPVRQVHLVQLQSPVHDLVYKLSFAVCEPLLTHGSFGLVGCVLYRCDQFLVFLVLL